MFTTYRPLYNEYRHNRRGKAFCKDDALAQELDAIMSHTSSPSLYEDATMDDGVPEGARTEQQADDWYSRKNLTQLLDWSFKDAYQPEHQFGPDYVLPATKSYATRPEDPVKLRIGFVGMRNLKPMSLVTFFEERAKKSANKLALSVKRDNQWIHWTYRQYWEDVCLIAKAFLKLGLERYHAVALLGFNSPEWLIANLAAIFAGGIGAGIYTTNKPSACHYVLEHSRANIVLVENDEQLQKILEIRHSLPHLKTIIQYTGCPTHEDVFSWAEVMQLGRTVDDWYLLQRIKSLAINQCASVVYTSGTTGTPKAVMISHDNYLYTCEFINNSVHFREGNEVEVSFLPMNHLYAQITDLYIQLKTGGHVYFAKPDAMKGSLGETLVEVQPTMFCAVPRLYEKIEEKIKDVLKNSNVLKNATVTWAMQMGYQYSKSIIQGNPKKPYGYLFAEPIIKKLKSLLGFKRTKIFVSSGAPISEKCIKFFMGLNIIIMETFGMSESTAPHVINTIDTFRLGSVGKNTVHNDTKLIDCGADRGKEICFRGRHVSMGYMFEEEKTKEALDEDGWLHTGDLGMLDDEGYLYISGRLKELLVTSGGENIGPVYTEDMVKLELPIVGQAVLIGDRRKYLTMLLTLKTEMDMTTMSPLDQLSPVAVHWCRSVGSSAKKVQDILQGPDARVMKAIQEGIDRVNQRAISRACHVQKWRILSQDFSLHNDELSPTGKLRRHVITERYIDEIEAMYATD